MNSNDIKIKFPHEYTEIDKNKNDKNPEKEIYDRIKKTKPIAGFVSTSILTSSDGLFGDHVEEKNIREENINEEYSIDGKTLYDRLKEQRDKKENEWKEKHNPYVPPKAIDEEEYAFLEILEEKHKKLDLIKKKEKELAIREFSQAMEKNNRTYVHKDMYFNPLNNNINNNLNKNKRKNEFNDIEASVKVIQKKKKQKNILNHHPRKKNKNNIKSKVIKKKTDIITDYSSSNSESSSEKAE